jgi:hypothetical protein
MHLSPTKNYTLSISATSSDYVDNNFKGIMHGNNTKTSASLPVTQQYLYITSSTLSYIQYPGETYNSRGWNVFIRGAHFGITPMVNSIFEGVWRVESNGTYTSLIPSANFGLNKGRSVGYAYNKLTNTIYYITSPYYNSTTNTQFVLHTITNADTYPVLSSSVPINTTWTQANFDSTITEHTNAQSGDEMYYYDDMLLSNRIHENADTTCTKTYAYDLTTNDFKVNEFSESVYGMKKDKRGDIWALCSSGLKKLTFNSTTRTFDIVSGCTSISTPAALRTYTYIVSYHAGKDTILVHTYNNTSGSILYEFNLLNNTCSTLYTSNVRLYEPVSNKYCFNVLEDVIQKQSNYYMLGWGILSLNGNDYISFRNGTSVQLMEMNNRFYLSSPKVTFEINDLPMVYPAFSSVDLSIQR